MTAQFAHLPVLVQAPIEYKEVVHGFHNLLSVELPNVVPITREGVRQEMALGFAEAQ